MIEPFSAVDFPANPLDKPGYQLDFNDEFDGPEISPEKWLPYYLPHWSSKAQSAPRYRFDGSSLILQITADQPPWCPEFDGEIRCSSIQTGTFSGSAGSTTGQHRFNRRSVVREEQTNERKYTPQYGYFEVRAKAVAASANHVAFWMIGYEDTPERSAEIAVMEIMGAYMEGPSARVGVHPWGDAEIRDEFYEDFFSIDATFYHVYAAEWTPTHIDFYLDNVRTRTIHQSPAYPMQLMLSIYERPVEVDTGASYPREFAVDYVRVYQPIGGYPANTTSAE